MKPESSSESRIESLHLEMTEGPEAAEAFTRLVRGIVNVPGAEVRKKIEKEHKSRIKKRSRQSASRASGVRDKKS